MDTESQLTRRALLSKAAVGAAAAATVSTAVIQPPVGFAGASSSINVDVSDSDVADNNQSEDGVVFHVSQETQFTRDSPPPDEFLVTLMNYQDTAIRARYRGVTVRQALDMASGVRWSWRLDDPESELMRWFQAIRGTPIPVLVNHHPDVIIGQWKLLPTLVRQFPPGSTIAYRESDVQAVLWATARVGKERFADLFSERIWTKLGAEHDAVVPVDSFGFPIYTMVITLRDFGRWGQMLLQNGNFNGQEVVPAWFVNDVKDNPNVDTYAQSLAQSVGFEAGTPWVIDVPPATGYRSFFWLPGDHEGAFLAWGHLGQFCYVSPKYETVLVKFGTFGGGNNESFTHDWHALHQIAKALP